MTDDAKNKYENVNINLFGEEYEDEDSLFVAEEINNEKDNVSNENSVIINNNIIIDNNKNIDDDSFDKILDEENDNDTFDNNDMNNGTNTRTPIWQTIESTTDVNDDGIDDNISANVNDVTVEENCKNDYTIDITANDVIEQNDEFNIDKQDKKSTVDTNVVNNISNTNKIANDERVKKVLHQIFSKIDQRKKNNINCIESLKNTKTILKKVLEKINKNEDL